MEINKDNVEELWGLYEIYKDKFRKQNYSDQKPMDFEDYVDSCVKKCNNCLNYYDEEDMGTSELALEQGICMYCMQDGYGQ